MRTAAAALIAITAWGQERPRFEAVSVKASESMSTRHVLLPPVNGRLRTNMATLRLLIENAYGVQSFQITGGPDWMNSTGFDIDAKASGNPTRAEVWLMLQSLLEERFQLRTHRETRVAPVYELTAARGGLKLPSEAADCEADAAAGGGQRNGPCGDATIAFEPAMGLAVIGRRISVGELARVLAGILQRPVIDKTGVSQRFDVQLRFGFDAEMTIGIGNPWPAGDPSGNPPVETALQQTLGLKLTAAKGPTTVLVVERAERPSEN
jgi:uncharacterized protein (TIGR03435 family)